MGERLDAAEKAVDLGAIAKEHPSDQKATQLAT
jgi:hypothetical protein